MKGARSLASDCFLVAIGYHGKNFHGSQIQPNVRTVQGVLIDALKEIGWWSKGCLWIFSRTDAGVSVRMNLIRLELPDSVISSINESAIIRALNDRLPDDIVAWGAKKTSSITSSRPVISRKYFYRCQSIKNWPKNVDLDLLIKGCQLFVGTHNFTNLCRLEDGKDPVRKVTNCEPWLDDNQKPIGISVTAESFLWNQVRRMASAITGIVSGDYDLDYVYEALKNPHIPVDMGMGTSRGLILWEINHASLGGLGMGSTPDTGIFSIPPQSIRGHKTWMSLSDLEMSTMINSEWIKEIGLS